jgi:deoxyribodipyrimidine photo-lyase
VQHKFIFELGWREYFRHVWSFRAEAILQSLHEGPLPQTEYATRLPEDIRQAATGVPVIDQAVKTLYASGYLHNHARMWLASYIVHLRKVHWRVGADWMYGHLLDGDLASNHLSWQWVAGTGSRKPYLFNADSVSRYAPAEWHSPGSVIDQSYEVLDRIARQPLALSSQPDLPAYEASPVDPAPMDPPPMDPPPIEPPLFGEPPGALDWNRPDAAAVADRDVWLVHPWSLGALPAGLCAETVVVGIFLSDFHQAWPWNEKRWRFVAGRMAELAPLRWQGDAAPIEAALRGARRVRSIAEPHLAPWLARLAVCEDPPRLFPAIEKRCDSFSQWWTRASRGVASACDLLRARSAPTQ